MKKQTKKQTTAKRYVAKPKAKAKPNGKPVAKPKAEPTAKTKAKPKKPKPVVAPPSPKAKSKKAKPVVIAPVPPIAEPKAKPVAALPSPLPPSVAVTDQSEMDELRRIELAITEAENATSGTALRVATASPVSTRLTAEVTDLLEELIDTASPKLASTVSRLVYVLCDVMPDLQSLSERADMVLCRKLGVTFGWDRRAEAERAVHSGQRQKSISIS